MSDKYDFRAIEEKWQKRWEDQQQFAAIEEAGKKKFYMLEMLPYPSGALHMGHVRNYSLGDSIARFRKLQGYNVLHPIGWDAFGLPAENAAIKNKIAPEEWTLANISQMKAQCIQMGFAYDWNREIASCLPDYYRWNQWFFLKMFEKGLAYKKKGQVNWCNQCQTVLANEQVVNGGCWRDDSPVEVKEFEQWYLRISDYADELLEALDGLEAWPEKVRTMQRNWIGKSIGTRVEFKLEDGTPLEIFTTRVDTIYGATFVVLAPEHELVRSWTDDPEHGPQLAEFAEQVRRVDKIQRTDEAAEKLGVFTGRYAINPYNGERVPVWIANFVLMDYGTGAIMAVPAHDQRDFEFASKYGIPIRQVILPADGTEGDVQDAAFTEYGVLANSGAFSGLGSAEAQAKMTTHAEEQGFGSKSISYRLKDWGISRQRYWGTPIPIIHCPECGSVPVPEADLPVKLPRVEGLSLGGSPLEQVESFVKTTCPGCGGTARRETDTMDTFIDSSWYFYRYADARNEGAPFDGEKIDYWFPVDIYIGGVEHAVMHLIYMRFFTKVMRDLGLVKLDEPVHSLFTQGMVIKDGSKMSKSKGNVVAPDLIVERYGADALRLFIQFCAPPDGELDWIDSGLEGCYRFLNRYWRFVDRYLPLISEHAGTVGDLTDRGRALQRKLHQTIPKVATDIERVHQNTAVAAIMEFLNAAYDYVDKEEQPDPGLLGEVVRSLTLMLYPFCPHVSEEVWERLGNGDSIALARWPEFDVELAREDELEIVVQVNGKVRGRFSAPVGVSREAMEKLALEDEKVQSWIEGKTVRKVIAVPGKLVNIVVSG
ncbi:MAG: leucine--tRNA ligase [Acidobacteriota bacterium]|nr:MAG: leucine--tRNA ligase [Acidobacteriota bacterium]